MSLIIFNSEICHYGNECAFCRVANGINAICRFFIKLHRNSVRLDAPLRIRKPQLFSAFNVVFYSTPVLSGGVA